MNDTDTITEEAEKITTHLRVGQGVAPFFNQTPLSASRANTLKHLLLEGNT